MDVAIASSSTATELSKDKVSELQLSEDYAIKSEAVTPKLGESTLWAGKCDQQIVAKAISTQMTSIG